MKTYYNEDIKNKFSYISEGDESIVFKHNNIVLKKFINYEDIDNKINKINKLSLIDSNVFPKILGLYKINENSKKCSGYFMEYIKGESLLNILNNKNIEINIKLKYLYKYEKAIISLHKHNIIIGDISFHNVLVNEDGEIKIIDMDNWMIENLKFDILLNTTYEYLRFSKREYKKDMDIYSFTIKLLKSLCKNDKFLKIYNTGNNNEMIKYVQNIEYLKADLKDKISYNLIEKAEKSYYGEILINTDCKNLVLTK